MPYKDRNKRIEYSRQWHSDNPEKIKQYTMEYKEKQTKMDTERYWNNREYELERNKQWCRNNPEKVRAIARKKTNKRDRCLGFNPLNGHFENSEAHHINPNDVIYIPETIHKSVSHCLETGKNMDTINILAIAYLEGVV